MAWCPNSAIALVAAAVDQHVYLINPGVGDRLVQAKTDEILKESPDRTDNISKNLSSVYFYLFTSSLRFFLSSCSSSISVDLE